MDLWQEFHGPNAAYILDLYDRYRQNPDSVDPNARALFQEWQPDGEFSPAPAVMASGQPGPATEKIMAVVNLATAIREYGHLAAHIDPLGLANPPGDPALHPSAHGLTEDDLRGLPAALVGGPAAEGAANALEAIAQLRRVYSTTIGYDYDHIRLPEERNWLRQAAESRRFRPPQDPLDPHRLLG
ncbi:MAG TPA: 2-oxoglutarate dehydrogenase E1 component, partial [Promineifilum sp.]|nr:2-oxoglutarate dehydrogenase E1 component [Promineifilum sp.]